MADLPLLAGGSALAGKHAAIELVDDAGHVRASLAVGRYPMVFVHGGGAGVVGGKRERDVVVIAA